MKGKMSEMPRRCDLRRWERRQEAFFNNPAALYLSFERRPLARSQVSGSGSRRSSHLARGRLLILVNVRVAQPHM